MDAVAVERWGDPVAVGHVADHWDELLRLVTSIRSGTVTASAMLRRLSAYPRQNGLALALRDVLDAELSAGDAIEITLPEVVAEADEVLVAGSLFIAGAARSIVRAGQLDLP